MESMQLVIKNGMILQGNGTFAKGHIGLDNGKIAALWYGGIPEAFSDVPSINAENYLISPGFVDTHMHGGMGFDFSYDKPGWEKTQERLASHGVTSVLATLSSRPPEATLKYIDRIAGMAKENDSALVNIAGIHMEGPYLNKKKNGIHVEEYIRPGDLNEVKRILERAGGLVRLWSVAPDYEENIAVTKYLAAAGVPVSIAHTEADYDTAMAAFSAGANRVTHTFNAMPPLNHRYTGIVTAAWQQGAYMELIADGYHVSPTVAKMFIAASDPGKIILVSDNEEFSGLPDGKYVQDGRGIVIAEKQMRTEFGVLVGSLICVNEAALNVTRWGFPAGTALKMASENPARAIGVFDRKGSIAPGKDADIVILDNQFEAMVTIKGGRIVYQSGRFS